MRQDQEINNNVVNQEYTTEAVPDNLVPRCTRYPLSALDTVVDNQRRLNEQSNEESDQESDEDTDEDSDQESDEDTDEDSDQESDAIIQIPTFLRFVVNTNFSLWLAQSGPVSIRHSVPSHYEISGQGRCLAAGEIEVNDAGRIMHIDNRNVHFRTADASLCWVIMILLTHARTQLEDQVRITYRDGLTRDYTQNELLESIPVPVRDMILTRITNSTRNRAEVVMRTITARGPVVQIIRANLVQNLFPATPSMTMTRFVDSVNTLTHLRIR